MGTREKMWDLILGCYSGDCEDGGRLDSDAL
jgi:hypothetical protein